MFEYGFVYGLEGIVLIGKIMMFVIMVVGLVEVYLIEGF